MKQKIFHFWVYSYLCILAIPIVISLVVLLQSRSMLDEEVTRANDALLTQIQQTFDNQIKDIKRMGVQLSFEPKLVRYLKHPELSGSAVREEAKGLIDTLHTYAISNGSISDFYIFMKPYGYALTTTTLLQSDLLFDLLHGDADLSYDKWEEWVKRYHTGSFLNLGQELGNGDSADSFAYVQSIPLQDREKSQATLTVLLDRERLTQSISNIQLAAEGSVMLIRKDGRPFFATGEIPDVKSLPLDQLQGNSGSRSLQVNGQAFTMSYLSSVEQDWWYVSLVPTEIYAGKANFLRNLILGSVFCCLLLGGGLAYWLAVHNYRPIRNMMNLVSANVRNNMKDMKNEFSVLHAYLTEGATAQEEIGLRKREEQRSARSSFLARLLKGKVNTEDALAQAFKSFALTFETGSFAVLLFHLEDYSALFRSRENSDPDKELQFVDLIVTNIAEEIINRRHLAYSTRIDGMIACLVNIRGTPSDGQHDLLRAAAEAEEFLRSKFFIRCSIGISEITMGWAAIPACYEQALEAIEHRFVLGTNQIIPYTLISRPTNELYYPLDMERQLINLMAIGSYEEATAVVQDIMQANFYNGALSVQMGKLLMFELVGTMLKAVEQMQLSTEEMMREKTNLIRQLTECASFTEIEAEILGFLRLVCDYMQQKKKSHNLALKDELIAYLEEHLDDADINLSVLSVTFNITSSYLSKFFKEQTGENLLEYLNLRRVEKAKRLLVTTGGTIGDITEQCGFTNSNTFIRVFKKYEGITPGQFRQKEEHTP
ncbi:MAG: hypothetical protein K0R57_1263 [Paenibacillaceae bacterium]|jgi:AraC-like DNA-binding protein|nr:hypothetical protein [Paenibacillaceae bacterium]